MYWDIWIGLFCTAGRINMSLAIQSPIKTPFEIRETLQIQIGRTFIKASLLNFHDLKNYQKILEIEKKIKNERKEEFYKNVNNNNNYEQLETEYKDKNVEKKSDESNKMNIDEK